MNIPSLHLLIPTPRRFQVLSLLTAGLWLLLVYPALNWFYPEKLPTRMKVIGQDYGQYYAGALLVSHGIWEHFYPIPDEDYYSKPPEFQPIFATPLFNPDAKARQGKWLFYKQPVSSDTASLAPEMAMLCPQLLNECYYILPPITALLLWPLSLFEYQDSARLWFILLCFSYFGIAFFASRICQFIWNKPTYASGFVALLPVYSTLFGGSGSGLSSGNCSPILGFIISLLIYSWIKNRQTVVGTCVILLLLFKGIGLSWIPLLLIKPSRYKTIIAMGLITISLIGISLYLGGMEPYRAFLQLLPKVDSARGFSLQALVRTILGIDISSFRFIAQPILIGGLYIGYWQQAKANSFNIHPSALIAFFAGTLACFCVFNNIVWLHYVTHFLILPFSGWLLYEAFQRAHWKKRLILAILLGVLLLFSDSYIALLAYLSTSRLFPENYLSVTTLLSEAFGILWLLVAIFILVLAYRRLFRQRAVAEHHNKQSQY